MTMKMYGSVLILLLGMVAGQDPPHGLLVTVDDSHPSKAVHLAVLHEQSKLACEARLEHLRQLVASGEFETALEVALVLKNRDNLPSACHVDKLMTGVGTVYTTVATPHQKENATAMRTSTIRFRDDRVLPCKSKVRLHPNQAAVAGFELDEEFILAETPIICEEAGSGLLCEAAGISLNLTMTQALVYARTLRSGHRREYRNETIRRRAFADDIKPSDDKEEEIEAAVAADNFLEDIGLGFAIDEASTYVKGTKKILYIPVCTKNYGAGCGSSFNYGKTASAHGGNIKSYLQKLHKVTNDYLVSNSYGRFKLVATILDPIRLDFSSCSSITPLSYWSRCKSNSLDCHTYTKVRQLHGIDVINDFDFHIIVNRYCNGFSWSGIGWIGVQGSVINLRQIDYDASVVHELGHNFGTDHASFMSGGARGARAYFDSANTFGEYASIHSTMGGGYHESNGKYIRGRAEFMASSKIIFDWLGNNQEIATVLPYRYNNGKALCSPCSPIELQATDAGSIQVSGAAVAIEIECQASNRFFFLEYRQVTPSTPGVIASWTTVSYSSGRTGTADNTVLVDATPATSSIQDAMIAPGKDFTLYCGSSGKKYPVNVAVAPSSSSDAVLVTINSAAESAAGCVGTIRGRVSAGSTVQDAVYYDSSNADIAGIRCCNDNGRGDSFCPDGVYSTYDYFTALSECAAAGMRLCTIQEVIQDYSNTVGSGCGYDYMNVWASNSGACSVQPTAAGTCNAIADGKPPDGYRVSDATYADRNNNLVAGIRCCNDDNNLRGTSVCPNRDTLSTYTFFAASYECKKRSMRLCTIRELIDNQSDVWGTGCQYDHMNVWTSNTGQC